MRFLFIIWFGFSAILVPVSASKAIEPPEYAPLMEKAKTNQEKEPRKAIEFAEKALALLPETKFSELYISTSLFLAGTYIQVGDYQKTLDLCLKLEKTVLQEKPSKDKPPNQHLFELWYYKCRAEEESAKYQEAIQTGLKALQLAEDTKSENNIINFANMLAITNQHLGHYHQAIEYYLQALTTSEKRKDLNSTSMLLSNITGLCISLGNYEDALNYNRRGFEIAEKQDDKRSMIGLLLNKADLFQEMGKIKEQIEPYEQALKLSQEVSSKKDEAVIFANLSDVYLTLGDYNKCIEYSKKTMAKAENLNDEVTLLVARVNYAEAMGKLGNYDFAIKEMETVLKSFQSLDRPLDTVEMYQILADTCEEAGKFKKALDYQKKFSALHAELFNKEKQQTIAELKEKYESEKKNREIEILNLKVNQQKEDIQRQARQKYLILIILFLLCIVFFLFFRSYRHLFDFWKTKNHIGPYKIIRKIASGGMSNIFEVENVVNKFSGPFALKILREDLSSDQNQQTRLKREAMMIDSLSHPNIIKVFERGICDGNYFMVMELLPGRTLGNWLVEADKLAITDAIHVMHQVADALDCIHGKGIIHRDLKADNIMILHEDPPMIKLLDFGIAKSDQQTKLTETGKFMGTVMYLAPEQLKDQPLTSSTDIFSLGVLFYEMLTGKSPFYSNTSVMIIRNVLEENPPPVIDLRDDIPKPLSDLISKMIRKNPTQRPTAMDILTELDQLAADLKIDSI